MIQHIRNQPLVSIIIVNYNGQHLLQKCLTSLERLKYPANKREVLLVDNNSSDDSVPFVMKHFPQVKVIQNAENQGFTGGNITGFKAAQGEYIVLLNSDVTVDPNWLNALVKRAADPKVGIVSSRLRYATPFIELKIESAAVPRSKVFQTIDHSPIGVLIEDVTCETPALSELVYYKEGFYDKWVGEISTRRTTGQATILLPFKAEQDENTYVLTFHGLESTEDLTIPVTLYINGKKVRDLTLKPHQTIQIELSVSKSSVEKSFKWLIQNAGNVVLHNGYSKDRGSVVIMKQDEQREFYEEESAYFDQEVELLAACGASCLIKREVTNGIGFLDGNYFMYYEDVEYSMRTWRAGWKVVYEPMSIAYHQHRATTGNQESSFFLALVERNHLALIMTHFTYPVVIKELITFLARFAITFVKFVVFQFRDNELRAEIWRRKYEGRSSALKALVRTGPELLQTRQRMNSLWPINQQKLRKMLY